MISTEYQINIKQAKNYLNHKELAQSGASKKLADYFSLQGYAVSTEIAIPNLHPNSTTPFFADIWIEHENIIVELDGCKYHNSATKEKEERKDRMVKKMGYRILRLPFSIPNNLIYGGMKEPEKSQTIAKYYDWFYNTFCKESLIKLQNI